jgi:hypothetical protein
MSARQRLWSCNGWRCAVTCHSSTTANEPRTQAAIADVNALNSNIFSTVGGAITVQTLFRGDTPVELIGPYVSQFFLQPAPFSALAVNNAAGAATQQYNVYVPNMDYLTTEALWLAVQNGQSLRNPPPNFPFGPNVVLAPCYVFSGRCGASFVHVDELYQAYFMAALNEVAPGVQSAGERASRARPSVSLRS